MFIAAGGGMYLVGKTSNELLGLFGFAVVLGVIARGAMEFNDIIGINDIITGTWRIVGGVDSPSEIIPADCPKGTGVTAWMWPIGVLAFANAFPVFLAMVGFPLGLILLVLGGLSALTGGENDLFAWGYGLLAAGVVGLVVAGLVIRIVNWSFYVLGCQPF
jgi:hypothetical protein